MVLGKSGQLRIVDEQGVEREKYALPSGARLYFENGAEVKKGDRLAEWDPFNEPFVTDVDGTVQLKDIIDGRTVQERIDEATGKSTLTVIEFRSSSFRPGVAVCDADGTVKTRPDTGTQAFYTLPVGDPVGNRRSGQFRARLQGQTQADCGARGG